MNIGKYLINTSFFILTGVASYYFSRYVVGDGPIASSIFSFVSAVALTFIANIKMSGRQCIKDAVKYIENQAPVEKIAASVNQAFFANNDIDTDNLNTGPVVVSAVLLFITFSFLIFWILERTVPQLQQATSLVSGIAGGIVSCLFSILVVSRFIGLGKLWQRLENLITEKDPGLWNAVVAECTKKNPPRCFNCGVVPDSEIFSPGKFILGTIRT